MLYAAETWVMKAASLNCSRRNDCVRFFQKNSKGHNSTMGDNCNKNKKSYYMFKHVIIGGVMKLVGKEASKN